MLPGPLDLRPRLVLVLGLTEPLDHYPEHGKDTPHRGLAVLDVNY